MKSTQPKETPDGGGMQASTDPSSHLREPSVIHEQLPSGKTQAPFSTRGPMPSRGQRILNMALKAIAPYVPRIASIPSFADYIFGLGHFPPEPKGMVKPSPERVKQFADAVNTVKKLLITGSSGSGKTTLALQMRRSYLDDSGNRQLRRVPVFVRVEEAKSFDNWTSYFVELVAKSIASRNLEYRRQLSKAWFDKVPLILIIDDLDFIDSKGYRFLVDLLNNQSLHSVVCIFNERPTSGACWNDFAVMHVEPWKEDDAKTYIANRIPEKTSRDSLIDHLYISSIINRPLTAFHWTCLVDTYIAGRIFEIFFPPGVNGRAWYSVQSRFLKTQISTSGLEEEEGIRKLGGLAFKLMKASRSDFSPDDLEVSPSCLKELIHKCILEVRGDNNVAFAPGAKQALLASEYVTHFWNDSKNELEHDDALNLVWSEAYNCIAAFLPDTETRALHDIFSRLAIRSQAISFDKGISPLFTKAPTRRLGIDALPDVDYGIFDSSMRVLFEDNDVQYYDAIRQLGRFSLWLIVEGKTVFTPHDVAINLDSDLWNKVRPCRQIFYGDEPRLREPHGLESDLLFEHEGNLNFIRSVHQAFLAGKYLSHFWPKARELLCKPLTTNPIWTDVFRFTAQSMPTRYREEFKSAFVSLVEREIVKGISTEPTYPQSWDQSAKSRYLSLLNRQTGGGLSDLEMEEWNDLGILMQAAVSSGFPEERLARTKDASHYYTMVSGHESTVRRTATIEWCDVDATVVWFKHPNLGLVEREFPTQVLPVGIETGDQFELEITVDKNGKAIAYAPLVDSLVKRKQEEWEKIKEPTPPLDWDDGEAVRRYDEARAEYLRKVFPMRLQSESDEFPEI